jgi:hypothetical protein
VVLLVLLHCRVVVMGVRWVTFCVVLVWRVPWALVAVFFAGVVVLIV